MPGRGRLTVTSAELVKALELIGFERVRKKGSHLSLRNTATGHRTVVPMHRGNVARGTLSAILRQSGITADELRGLLGRD